MKPFLPTLPPNSSQPCHLLFCPPILRFQENKNSPTHSNVKNLVPGGQTLVMKWKACRAQCWSHHLEAWGRGPDPDLDPGALDPKCNMLTITGPWLNTSSVKQIQPLIPFNSTAGRTRDQ